MTFAFQQMRLRRKDVIIGDGAQPSHGKAEALLATMKPTQNGPRRESSPLSPDRDLDAQTTYVVISIAIVFMLLLGARPQWAVAWCMTTLFVFGVWRFGRSQSK